ncbi:MAG: cysteine--tRNA ligase [Spirochaetia bacterium]|nr:cysteine--tRNA ligase [Spirochaetia bacterium]
MSFYFYNTYTKKIDEFIPICDNKVSIYSCGPTVYNLAHIGNFRSYIFSDVLRRSLKLAGYDVEHVMNITDVDDKTIKNTCEKNPNPCLDDLRAYTKPFIDDFFADMNILGIDKVEHYPKATETIEPMKEMLNLLLDKEYAYYKDDSVYFSINKFKNYGNLSGIDLSSVKTGLRYNTDEYDKDDIRDFVLWKGEKESEKIAWETSICKGRPGWHLECSAMIRNIFHGTIDIHTGGVDLIFPHHENEIAQSEAAYGEKFVKYWIHCEHLLVDGKKMSKSLGNFYTLRDILDMGFDADAVRYLLLSVHYRQKLNFTLEGLKQTSQTIIRIYNSYNRLADINASNSNEAKEENINEIMSKADIFKKDFLDALKDDLNVSKALSVFHEAIRFTNQFLDEKKNIISSKSKEILTDLFHYMDKLTNILKNSRKITANDKDDIDTELMTLLDKRNEARKSKNYAEADKIRKTLEEKGYKILDSPTGSKLQKINL